jgi:hypothetical protein
MRSVLIDSLQLSAYDYSIKLEPLYEWRSGTIHVVFDSSVTCGWEDNIKIDLNEIWRDIWAGT